MYDMRCHLNCNTECRYVISVLHPSSFDWQYVNYLESSREPVMITRLSDCTRMNKQMSKRVLWATKCRYPHLPVRLRTIIYI